MQERSNDTTVQVCFGSDAIPQGQALGDCGPPDVHNEAGVVNQPRFPARKTVSIVRIGARRDLGVALRTWKVALCDPVMMDDAPHMVGRALKPA